MTTPPFNHGWEKQLHEKLRALPDLKAPDALIPSVMASIRARQEAVVAWYRRPATTWPVALQFSLGLAAVAVFLLAVFGVQQLVPYASGVAGAGPWHTFSTRLDSFLMIFEALGSAASAVYRTAIGPVLIGVIAAACFSYLALFGISGAIWRTVIHRPLS